MGNIIGNKRSQASREQMFRALFGLIQAKKLSDITVSELCELAEVNRTTFYSHYENISALAQDARESIVLNYAQQFAGNTDGYTPENMLVMFRYIYHNQIVFRIYFQLNPSYQELLSFYDQKLARRHYPAQNDILIRYHAEFFAAGITAIIRRWLDGGCKETPEEMVKVILTEYKNRG